MVDAKRVFSSFSVDDLEKAQEFYSTTLGMDVENVGMGLRLKLAGGGSVFLYPKETHQPATFTVLNLEVQDIDAAVDALVERGVALERYEGFDQDERGIARSPGPERGPSMAWLKDPAGNVIGVMGTMSPD